MSVPMVAGKMENIASYHMNALDKVRYGSNGGRLMALLLFGVCLMSAVSVYFISNSAKLEAKSLHYVKRYENLKKEIEKLSVDRSEMMEDLKDKKEALQLKEDRIQTQLANEKLLQTQREELGKKVEDLQSQLDSEQLTKEELQNEVNSLQVSIEEYLDKQKEAEDLFFVQNQREHEYNVTVSNLNDQIRNYKLTVSQLLDEVNQLRLGRPESPAIQRVSPNEQDNISLPPSGSASPGERIVQPRIQSTHVTAKASTWSTQSLDAANSALGQNVQQTDRPATDSLSTRSNSYAKPVTQNAAVSTGAEKMPLNEYDQLPTRQASALTRLVDGDSPGRYSQAVAKQQGVYTQETQLKGHVENIVGTTPIAPVEEDPEIREANAGLQKDSTDIEELGAGVLPAAVAQKLNPFGEEGEMADLIPLDGAREVDDFADGQGVSAKDFVKQKALGGTYYDSDPVDDADAPKDYDVITGDENEGPGLY